MIVVCFADTRFPIERANGLQTMETCHGLARRGHDVTLVVRPDSATPARDPLEFYDLTPLESFRVRTIAASGSPRARRLAFLLSGIRQAARERDAIVFTRDLGLAALLLQLPRARRPRVVYESHGVASVVAEEMPRLLGKPDMAPSSAKVRRLDRRDKRVWKRAPAYVTITRELEDDLTERYGGRPHVFVVPDGARPAGAVPAPDREFTAGYAGHLYPWKGVDVFVEALAHAPGVKGLIVGGHPAEADLARVQELARARRVSNRLTIVPMVPPSQVAAALAPASVLVLPNPPSVISERYTSPLKLFEYLGMGRAIVASDLPSIREVLTHGSTAVLVPPGEPAPLGTALSALKDDEARREALAAASKRLAPRYTWDERARRLERAFMAAARP